MYECSRAAGRGGGRREVPSKTPESQEQDFWTLLLEMGEGGTRICAASLGQNEGRNGATPQAPRIRGPRGSSTDEEHRAHELRGPGAL